MDNKKISKLINELPICDDGKNKVTDILKEFGYTPIIPEREPIPGEVWVNGNDPVVILNDDHYLYFHTSRISKNMGVKYYAKSEKWEFFASCIEEAFKKLNKTGKTKK